MYIRAYSNDSHLSIHSVLRLLCSSESLGPRNLYQLPLLFLPLIGIKTWAWLFIMESELLGQLQFYSEDDMKSMSMPEVGSFPLEFLLMSFGQLPGGL